MRNIFRYISYLLFIISILILLKPTIFYAKEFIIQNRLNYQWKESIKIKQINIDNYSIYPIGKIKIKNLNLASIITGGSLDDALQVSIAHIPNTSMPGELDNICLAGHRDRFFKNLKDVKINDFIEIEHLIGIDQYQIKNIKIIEPHEVNYLEQCNEPLLTLITCYPFEYLGKAPLRYMVQAKKIEYSNL